MRLFAPKERLAHETRAALDPTAVKKLTGLGMQVTIESSLGMKAGHFDDAYTASGAHVAAPADAAAALTEADAIVRVQPPLPDDFANMKHGALHVSFLDPF